MIILYGNYTLQEKTSRIKIMHGFDEMFLRFNQDKTHIKGKRLLHETDF